MRNKKIARRGAGCLIALTALCLSTTTYAQLEQNKKLDRLCTWLADQSQGMGSIAVARNGKIIYANAFGYRAHVANRPLPPNVNTKYHTWSITKIYTATMILQLADEGKLSLEVKLSRFFPQVANASSITIRQMLAHQSGIHDFTQISDSSARPRDDSRQEMVSAIAAQQPEFVPGERFQYSNSNYLLLGYILEDLEQAPFATILSKRILNRLKLKNTFYQKNTTDTIQNRAQAFQFDNNHWQSVEEGSFGTNVPGAAGSIVSTPTDMAFFITALFSGRLIPSPRLTEMAATDGFYGLGIMKMPYNDLQGWGHGGGYIASHAMLVYYPQDSLAIAYCTNGARYPMQSIIQHTTNVVLNPAYVLPFEKSFITLTPAQQREYTGHYESPKFPIDITLEGGALTIQAGSNPKSPIRPIKKDHFLIEGTDMEITFERDKDENPAGFFIQQGDKKIIARRATSAPRPMED
ncbi:beta-lactamase family protein [Parachryseolinea silvisoli]|uniref:beta-lactamase family protein n=1 Tax=Parachryseolinea silvisoli TaxID=2873601 RepID=UPI002265A7E3|nr:beta-lactamase family protein [Parachryseolinea silvisoli]MCD9016637.1 beta-lactamase family protein [Parachryseolinea silvisoli]